MSDFKYEKIGWEDLPNVPQERIENGDLVLWDGNRAIPVSDVSLGSSAASHVVRMHERENPGLWIGRYPATRWGFELALKAPSHPNGQPPETNGSVVIDGDGELWVLRYVHTFGDSRWVNTRNANRKANAIVMQKAFDEGIARTLHALSEQAPDRLPLTTPLSSEEEAE